MSSIADTVTPDHTPEVPFPVLLQDGLRKDPDMPTKITIIADNRIDSDVLETGYDMAGVAVTTAQAAELFAGVRGLATGGVKILISDVAPS